MRLIMPPGKVREKSRLNDPGGITDRADRLLEQIASLKQRRSAAHQRVEGEMAAIRARYQAIGELDYMLDFLDRELTSLMRTHEAELFGGRDNVRLPHGLLLHGRSRRLALPRNVLERLKDQGWHEAIRTTETVDRGLLAGWPAARLKQIGGCFKGVSRWAYESWVNI
jgi:hypothetical protein